MFVTYWSTIMMRLTIFQILAFTFFISCSLARNLSFLEQNPNVIANRSVPEDDRVKITKRDDTKYVFMHLIVGSAFPYTNANWIDDIQQIQAKGVDAVALNLGQDDWELTQVATAYAAAESLGTNFKLFFSFDFTAMSCTLSNFVSIVNKYANHPNQFKVDGKPMISSFEGECLGNTGWASLKNQTNGYSMPFISGLEGTFPQWPALDSWYCWGCAFTPTGQNISTADDEFYINQLGDRYATTVSGWMFTHFSYKNWFQSGGDWLLNLRWEELMSLRDNLTFVEMITWNDFGESDYFGPLTSIATEAWATNFPHTSWFDMSQYYITAFKTGSYPTISNDVVYFWARSHPANATASSDPLPRPSGYQIAEDSMWAVAFATSEATVTLQSGSSSSTFDVTPGVNKLKIPLSPGGMSVKMDRNGQTIVDETAQNFTYILNPVSYNYNAWVGSATASTSNTNSTQTSTSSNSSSPSLSATTSSAPTANITTLTTSTAIPPNSSAAASINNTSSTHTSTSSISSSSFPSTTTSSAASITTNKSSTQTSTKSKSSSSSPSTTTSSTPAAEITVLRSSTAIPWTSSFLTQPPLAQRC